MWVPLVVLGAASLTACVQSNRQRSTAETVQDAVVETAEDGGGDTAEDADSEAIDTGPVECRNDDECDMVEDPCRHNVCVDTRCVEQPRPEGSSCDDGLSCTGDGQCSDGTCAAGAPVVDGTSCDDDDLVCNGVPTCQGGSCAIALPPTCPASDNPCAADTECSEDAGGLCVDVPVEDGQPCPDPSGADGDASWQCSSGRCAPPDMVFVSGGVFTMGCPEGYCNQDNGPAHEVQISPFFIDRVELSELEFRRCRDDDDGLGVSCGRRNNEESAEVLEAPELSPARWINWRVAESACAYFGKRLCSEAEWEYAARGQGDNFYPWGNFPPTCARATFFGQGGAGCGTDEPSMVGTKPQGASPYGALDMAGNVREWCADYYNGDLYPERAGSSVVDPLEGWSGVEAHVVRGGSFRDGVAPLRVFARDAEGSGVFSDDLGVRCCRAIEETR